MSVEFDENIEVSNNPRVLYSKFQSSNQVPKIVRALVKSGIVKTEKQASYFLIGFLVVAIGFSIYLFSISTNTATIQDARNYIIQHTL